MNYPRILIIGETFRLNGGGGITLTNLFKEWPAENIGVITDLIEHTNPLTEYKYYQLGSQEIKFPFPFNYIQRYFKSGGYTFIRNTGSVSNIASKPGLIQTFKKVIRPAFDNFLNKIGLYAYFYKIKLSSNLINWIKDFNPDIIYIQPFHNRMMRFGNNLYSELKVPYAIHIMDDSIKYINQSIFFTKKIQKTIEADFKKLIANAHVHLCISEAMGEEYYIRYGKKFLPFRNPIDVGDWNSIENLDNKNTTGSLKIIYSGRIFKPTFDSFFDLCKIVDKLNHENFKVELEFTMDNTPDFRKKIKNFKGISFHPMVDGKDFPAFIQQFDIFFICLNFDFNTKKYFQFSMSTRVSEGQISGVPVLVYAPSDFAISKYFDSTNSGCVVGQRDLTTLEESIKKLWNDKEYKTRISKNAIATAKRDSDAKVVRDNFRKTLTI